MRRLPAALLALALGSGGALAVAAPATASGTASDWAGFTSLVSGECTGNAVTLGADITAPAGGSVQVGTSDTSGCDLTLDLAGHALDISDVPPATAAIGVRASNTLTIVDSAGGGTLHATGGIDAAGIGGGDLGDGGTVTISGGDVTATGGIDGAGIGGAGGGGGGTVTISGGDVTATGGDNGAGIGATGGDGGTVEISGGDVTATGGDNGAGIGGGLGGDGATVTISGGTVLATGGDAAPGIGSGAGGGVAGTLTIIGAATPGSAVEAGPTNVAAGGVAADIDYAGGPWVTAESTVAAGGKVRVEFVPGVLTTITVHGPATADAGDTVAFTAEGTDQFGGSLGDVTRTATWASDVADDVVSGNEVTFTHASPHTITATVGTVSGSLVVEVTAAEDAEVLPATGVDAAPVLALGVALLAAGSLTIVLARRRRA